MGLLTNNLTFMIILNFSTLFCFKTHLFSKTKSCVCISMWLPLKFDLEKALGNWKYFIGTIETPSDLLFYVGKDTLSGKHLCTICNKYQNINKSKVRDHIESIHFPKTFSYQCDLCDKTSSSKRGLEVHRSREHPK